MVRNQPEVTQHDEPVLGRFRGGGGPVPGSKREEAQDELLLILHCTSLDSKKRPGTTLGVQRHTGRDLRRAEKVGWARGPDKGRAAARGASRSGRRGWSQGAVSTGQPRPGTRPGYRVEVRGLAPGQVLGASGRGLNGRGRQGVSCRAGPRVRELTSSETAESKRTPAKRQELRARSRSPRGPEPWPGEGACSRPDGMLLQPLTPSPGDSG